MNQLVITFLFSFLPTESLPRMLESPDPGIRAAAAIEIGDRCPETKNLVPALVKPLKDSNSLVRQAAADALSSMGRDAKAAVDDLLRAAHDGPDARTRAACLVAATNIVRWVTQNGLEWSRARHIAAQPRLLRGARSALSDRRPIVRLQAVGLLDVISENCPDAVAALSEALRDPDSSVRQRAAKALLEAGPAGRTTIAALRRVLSDPCITVRAQAALALWQMREPAKSLVPALIDLLQPRARKDRGRTRIDWAVAEITDAAICVLGFEDADGAEQERLVKDALSSLQDMGVPVERFEPTLKALLQDDSPPVRLGAAGVLLRATCHWDAAIRTLISLVRDGPGDMRLKAASWLALLGPEASPFVPVFVSMLRDDDESNTGWSRTLTSLRCLASIGQRAAPALPRLDELIRHGSPIIRVEAAKTRWAIDPKPEAVVLALANGIADPLTRPTALEVLEEIGPSAKLALPGLKRVVATPRAIYCLEAAMVLWRISGQSNLTVDVLIQVLEAKNRQAPEPAVQKTGIKFSVQIVDRQSGVVSDASVSGDASEDPVADLSTALFDLREIGPAAKKARPTLEQMLKKNKVSEADRLMVAMTLAALDPDNPAATRRFARLLSEVDSGTAAGALASLKGMGSRAKWAVPILKPMLKDADEARRTAAADALKAVQTGETATGN